MKESVKDKIKGLVFGAALGDAVGLATEFLTKQEATHLYGQGPIRFGSSSFSSTTPDEQGFPFHRDGHRSRWQEGDFTDDTDQLLLLVQSVLATGGSFDFRDFAARLKYWIGNGLVFPDGSTKPPCGIGRTVSLVVGSPGFTDDPHRAAWNVWENYGRQLAANGAVMRSAALGAVVFHDEVKMVKNAIDAAQVTHADPRCLVSCVIVNVLIAQMLCMDDLGADVSSMALLTTVVNQYKFLLQPGASAPAPWTPSSPHTFEPSSATTDFLQHAFPSSLSSLNLSSGGIGYTFKALGAATYLFTRDIDAHFECPAEAFVSLITELVLEGGDADTNACVAGALLGCRVGYKELPEHWVAGLRHRTQLEQLVDQFCSLP
ncbi:ADP-ribosylation/Crystallin J1 [Powellomyces hirtus]|nr:ADP-ribosylation/Crystallin J1 [Powellomyces hirtus]